MSLKSVHRGARGRVNGSPESGSNGSANGKTVGSAIMDEKPYPKTKEPFPKSTPTLEAPASTRLLRTILLLTYFWTSVFVLAITQYIGAPLYLIKKDYYYRYMAFAKQGMALLILTLTEWWTATKVYVSGDESVTDQIHMLPDGRVECKFAPRAVLIANHQMYNDWVYLWWTTYTAALHGHVYIVLKQSISYIPIVGLGLRLAGFVFMSRKMKTDQPRLTRRLAQLTRRNPEGKLVPMWLLMFPEGTNLSKNGRAASVKWAKRQDLPDLRYQLIPRSTGTYFCLKGLDNTVEWVYDCTLAYDGVPEGKFGQDVFPLTSIYVSGLAPPIHMHWRRFAVSSIPLSSLEEFDSWLQERWLEKDRLLEIHTKTGRFPSALKGDEHLKTEVKLGHWSELWKFCGVLILQLACIIALLYRGKKAV